MVKYQELWNEENTNIRERYDLAMERILEIPSEERVAEPYRSYFNQMAAFTAQIEELARLHAEEIYDTFGVSKKTFKKAVGDLYKKHLVSLQENGIELAKKL